MLIHFSAETMWKHGKKQKYDFYCLWLFVNYENWCRGPQDLHLYLCNTFVKSKDKVLFYLAGKGQKVHLRGF